MRQFARRFFFRPSTIAAVFFILAVIGSGVLADRVLPNDPNKQNLRSRLQQPGYRDANNGFFPLGTDQLGRDMLSRLVYGARVSLPLALGSVLVSAAIGVTLGLLAGYFGGVAESVIMRLVDIQLAFPFVLITLALVALLGTSVRNIVLVFALTSWTVYARVTRSSVLAARSLDYVEAARSVGVPTIRIVTKHIFPATLSPLIVIASFEVARLMVTEAALTFLGVGVPSHIPSWGSMIADGRMYVREAWWVAAIPGLALTCCVLSINFIGDALRDALDQRELFQG